jgi:alkaline phosphatase
MKGPFHYLYVPMHIKLFLLLPACFLILQAGRAEAQVLVHSHNDYSHAGPFRDAYREKANSIEADVFPVNGRLMVAHAREAIRPASTLESMYLNPIIALFQKHHHKTVSDDPAYTFYLMIDIKENWEEVLPLLIKKLKAHPACFNRGINPMAVQVFISGERPPDSTFHTYPPEIMFDGLPGKKYRPPDLQKIVMISTDFHLYSSWNGTDTISAADEQKLKRVISGARQEHKPVRFWGAPDTPDCWKTLVSAGADVINTDKIKDCKVFLEAGHWLR